jgi:hypothetical protein
LNEKNMLCIVCDKQQDIPETERRTMGIEIYFTGMLKQAVGALVLSPAYKGVEEIRLRVNRPVRILREGKIYFLLKKFVVLYKSVDCS